jgi:hypothetical protein
MTVAVTDPEETRQLWAIMDLLKQVDGWVRLVEGPSPTWTVRPGSRLARDDALCGGYQVSHCAQHAITAGIDHLNCLRRSLDPAQRGGVLLHTHAQATLLRSAVENGSRAVWLLGADSRRERIRRRLALQADEIKNSNRFAGTTGIASLRPEHVRTEALRTTCRTAGLSKDEIATVIRGASYATIVKEAASAAGIPARTALVAWRGGSALAHGDTYALLSILEQERVSEQNSVVQARVSPSVTFLLIATEVAVLMHRCAIDVYRRLASSGEDH